MKKYIIEEPKLVALLNDKMINLMQASAEIFAKLNPTLSLQVELSPEEQSIIGQLQRGEIAKKDIPPALVDKIDFITSEIERVDQAEKEGKVDLGIFTVEDVRKHLTFTDEEILNVLYGGTEKEQLSEN
jgi:hypothetical protein